jgi:2-oxo-3-hexenedioate decarboxylase
MEQSKELRNIAQELKTAQDQRRQIAPLSSRIANFAIEDAYIVAGMIHKMRMNNGESPVGRKIGFTNPKICSYYGMSEPIWGYVYDSTVIYSTGGTARCNCEHCPEPLIEPEIIVHFHSAPPTGGDAADILACIDWIAHGIEIVQSHFPDWQFQAADTVADCGLHAMLIVGEPVETARLGPNLLSDLETFTITLFCNDNERDRGQGANVMGNPVKAVEHLNDVLSRQPHAPSLQANELVTTGSLTAALPITGRQRWSTELAGIALPGISVSFAG